MQTSNRYMPKTKIKGKIRRFYIECNKLYSQNIKSLKIKFRRLYIEITKEQKEAIEYSKNCLMKIALGIDCEFDVNILNTLLNIIKKLQKENEKYKEFFDLMFKLDPGYFMHCEDEETNKLVDEILKLESEKIWKNYKN